MFIEADEWKFGHSVRSAMVIQEIDKVYAAAKHTTPDGVRRSMHSRAINMQPLTG